MDKLNIKEELLSKTIKHSDTQCWEYKGSLNDSGYGRYSHYLVHRLSLWIFKAFNLNSKLDVLHTLECKLKSCWNPEHLYTGDASDNLMDVVKLGSHWHKKKTHCPKGHEYTPQNTILSQNRRNCKKCHNLIANKARDRRKKNAKTS